MGEQGVNFKYKAFISYSHAADGTLAPRLQAALRRFAILWYRWRSRPIFRDETGLGMTPELWPEIQKALDASEHFILLASPRAAQSQWVAMEVGHWLGLGRGKPLIVWTDGIVKWAGSVRRDTVPGAPAKGTPVAMQPKPALRDLGVEDTGAADFDWEATTALPQSLRGVYHAEPLYLDLSWARSGSRVTLRDPRFRTAVARLTAAVEGKDLEQIIGQDVRYRRSMLTSAITVGLLLMLLTAASLLLRSQAAAARMQAELRLANVLTTEGVTLGASDRWIEARGRFIEARQIFTRLGASDFAGEVGLWNYYRHAAPVLHTFQAHRGAVVHSALSGKGERLVTVANQDGRGSVSVWDTTTWSLVRAIEQPADIRAIALSPDGKSLALVLASGSSPATGLPGRGSLILVDPETGKPKDVRLPASEDVLAVAWAGNGKLVTGGSNRRVNVWDIATGQRAALEVENPAAYVNTVGGSEDGRIIAWGSDWKGSSAGERPVTSVAVAPDGKMQAYGHSSGLVSLTGSAAASASSLMMDGPVQQLSFGLDGLWLLGHSGPRSTTPGAAGGDSTTGRTIRIWDVQMRREARALEDIPRDVTTATIARNSPLVVAGDAHGHVTVWGLWYPAMRWLSTADDLSQHQFGGSTYVCPGGRLLLRVGTFGDAELWSTDMGRRLRRYKLPPAVIKGNAIEAASAPHHLVAIAASADLRFVVGRDNYDTIFAWDLATAVPVDLPKGLADLVASPLRAERPQDAQGSALQVISPDGTRGAGGDGAVVKVFAWPSRHPLPLAWQHGGAVRALTFGPSKDWIFSSSADRTLRLWQVAKSDGEWFVLTIGFPRILGHGFIEVPETGAPTWDAGGNNIVTQSALIDQLHFFTNPDRWLLAHSEWGVWLGNLSWPTRANAIQVDVTAARARLDANPQDARALQTIAAWFALNGSCESALIFFERAQSAGGQPDPFLLGCCYLNAAGQREPSPAEAATREAYDKMVRDWHAHRLELAAKAKLRFDDAAKTSAVSASQGQVAAVYAAISAAIQQEEQQPTAQ